MWMRVFWAILVMVVSVSISCAPSETDPIAFSRDYEVWVMSPDGSDQVKLVSGFSQAPQWVGPERNRILYVTSEDRRQADISSIDVTTHTITRLTTHAENDVDPVPVLGGTKVVYCADRGPYQIQMVDIDGTDNTVLASRGNYERYPSASPDGQRIAFSRRVEGLVVLDLNNRIEQQIVDCDDLGEYDEIRRSSWSPDGSRIALFGESSYATAVFVVRPSGEDLHMVVDTVFNVPVLTWSPDSESILVTKVEAEKSAGLVRVNVESGELEKLTWRSLEDGYDVWPAYSPSGKQIAFCRGTRDSTDLWIMDANGGNQKLIAENAFSPCW